jgi:tetratricopeptide (TPR) repeat protein
MFDRENPIDLINSATVHHQDGNHDLAIADFTKAIDLKPDAAEAFYGRGMVHQRQNALADALADYDKAIELDPAYIDALFKRSAVYRLKGDFDRAAADFDRAIQILWHQRAVKAEPVALPGEPEQRSDAPASQRSGSERSNLEHAA